MRKTQSVNLSTNDELIDLRKRSSTSQVNCGACVMRTKSSVTTHALSVTALFQARGHPIRDTFDELHHHGRRQVQRALAAQLVREPSQQRVVRREAMPPLQCALRPIQHKERDGNALDNAPEALFPGLSFSSSKLVRTRVHSCRMRRGKRRC